MKHLFISFTGTLNALCFKTISPEALETGLFYFGCTRDHAITPGAKGEGIESIVRCRKDLHQLLVQALLKAETEGRVAWRQNDQPNSFAELNALLQANGVPAIDVDPQVRYSYPAVQHTCRSHQVIWSAMRC